MRFSIIIPLYNKAAYIRKALESVLQQVCTDWELTIVDDESTDGSIEEVLQWVSAHKMQSIEPPYVWKEGPSLNYLYSSSNIVRIVGQANTGVALARNRGVALAEGEYVCFLDADDWWSPNYLEEMEQLIAAYPNAGLYASNYVYYKLGKTHVALDLSTGYINYPQAYLRSSAMPIWTGAVCMPRRVFDEMGGFPVGIRLGEDFLLWAKTAMHYPIAFLNDALAFYNNDVPATFRATRNLHAPEHHMLWHLDGLNEYVGQRRVGKGKMDMPLPSDEDWQRLFDRLRVNGLQDYWLSPTYHEAAAEELRKVDWTQQSRSVVRRYKTPLWMVRVKRRVMYAGSVCKQWLYGLIHTKRKEDGNVL